MHTALIIIGVIVGTFFLLIVYSRIKMKSIPLVDDHKNIVKLTESNFAQQTKNRVILVDFWAEWCAPCRMMAPVLNDVAAELNGNSKVGKVNIEQYQSLAQKYKVRSIPTLILFKNGKEVDRFVGVKNKEFLLNQLHKA
jgi:thioredoxin 1